MLPVHGGGEVNHSAAAAAVAPIDRARRPGGARDG